MPDIETYLPDHVVHDVQGKLYSENPRLILYRTDFLTTRINPPWHGALPDGTIGWTEWPVAQFLVVSDHPRPMQRKAGHRHSTLATVWENVFDDALREYRTHNDKPDPGEAVFRLVLAKHMDEMDTLSSIQYDAVSDPSRPKSVRDVLPAKMFN